MSGLHTNRANVLQLLNRYDEAITLFLKSLRLSERNKDSLRMTTAYNNIGFLFSRLKEHEKSLQYAKRAKQMGDRLGTSQSNHLFHMNLANAYKAMNMIDSADYWYGEALLIAEKVTSPTRLAILYQNYGNFLSTQGQFIYAERFLQKALKMFEEQEVHVEVASVLRSLAYGAVYATLYVRRKREEERHRSQLIQLQQQHRIDTARSLREAEEERKKIANKLHDEVGALLSIAKLNVQQLDEEVFVAGSGADKKLDTVSKMLSEVSETVRGISHSLMPVALEKYGLKAGIKDLLTALQTSEKLKVE